MRKTHTQQYLLYIQSYIRTLQIKQASQNAFSSADMLSFPDATPTASLPPPPSPPPRPRLGGIDKPQPPRSRPPPPPPPMPRALVRVSKAVLPRVLVVAVVVVVGVDFFDLEGAPSREEGGDANRTVCCCCCCCRRCCRSRCSRCRSQCWCDSFLAWGPTSVEKPLRPRSLLLVPGAPSLAPPRERRGGDLGLTNNRGGGGEGLRTRAG